MSISMDTLVTESIRQHNKYILTVDRKYPRMVQNELRMERS